MALDDNLNNRIIIQAWKKKQRQQETRYPVEDPEGVDSTAFPRREPFEETPGVVSLSEIETLDLLSEGRISGLAEGEYSFVGTAGNVGYTSATYTPYALAPDTTVRWLRSVYWNEVPVVNSQNQFNFQSIDTAFTVGQPNGSLVGLLSNELTVSRQIGERLRYGTDFAKVYRLFNREIKAFEVNIRFNALSQTVTNPSEYGDVEAILVECYVQWRPLFSTTGKTPSTFPNTWWVPVKGKITNGYIEKTRINLVTAGNLVYEPDFLGWEVKVYRTTPDATTASVRSQTYIDSITEVFGDVFTYPNSAIISSRFSAEYFTQVPARAFDTYLLRVKVPSNYDPILKSYNGDWDGTFKDDKEWTDNPAWCFYDLITNKRYGLGKHISEDQVDKWTLYEIGKYCDTLVSNGEGGIEPRFTCNLYINSREEAYNVVNNLASIFQAMTYYFAGSIYTSQDALKEPLYSFTNANVENGDFSYSSSSRRVRHTTAMIRYNDKKNFYKPAVEYVEDFEGIRKLGIRELELTAFGCTSRGQAWRQGRWALLSETLETESVSFTAGLEGAYLRPGDIIQVQDNHRTTQRFGGRVYRIYDSSHLLLDGQVTGLSTNSLYYFSLVTPTFNYEPSLVNLSDSSESDQIRNSQVQKRTFLGSQVTPVTGDDGMIRSDITFSAPFDVANYVLTGSPVWTVEGSGISNSFSNQWNYYRVLRTEEQGQNRFAVSAIQYESGKFAAIESGLNFEEPNYINVLPTGPTNLQLSVLPLSTNTKKIDYRFTLPDDENINSYKVYIKNGPWAGESDFDSSTYLAANLQGHESQGSYYPTTNGVYYFRVYSVSRLGSRSSTYAAGNIEVAGMNALKDILIGGLVLEEETTDSTTGGTKKNSTAIGSDTVFKWQLGLQENGSYQTGLYYRFTAREPSNNSVPTKHIYFQRTGLLRGAVNNLAYEFTFYDNTLAISNQGAPGPFRTYDAVIEGMLADGTSTAGGNFVLNNDSDFSNPNGYDILAVANPRVDPVLLTEGNNFNSSWKSEQWINPDGEIKVRFINSSFPEDMAGGYAYYSTESFNRAEGLGLVTTPKVINSFRITESGNPFNIYANLTGASSAYLALAFYDDFDEAILQTGNNIQNQLNWSNVVKIDKRGDAQFRTSYFAAWLDMSVDCSAGNIDTSWAQKNFGVSNVDSYFTMPPGETVSSFGYRVYFSTPFSNTNYVVMGYEIGETSNFPDARLPRVVKYNDRFEVFNIIGQRFFGILYNNQVN